MKTAYHALCFLSLLQLALAAVFSASNEANGLNFVYPYPVQFFKFVSQLQPLSMAYMDVWPANQPTPKGTVVLLHGKNFCGATWNATISVLVQQGYRVITPDQIGFCKSTKPLGYQFSLQQLSLNTNSLLTSLKVTNAIILGHSMGGMLAARYALMYPSQTSQLALLDPLGLENWFALGVPYQAIDVTYQTELSTTFDSIKAYQQATYYVGTWDPSYDVWVNMLISIYNGSHGKIFAYNMAQTTDAVFTQPIIAELPNLKMKTLLIVGDKDNTAIGKAWAPASVKPLLGHYDVLGRQVSAMIPNCSLVAFPDLGHSPQIQAPDRFHAALLGWLQS